MIIIFNTHFKYNIYIISRLCPEGEDQTIFKTPPKKHRRNRKGLNSHNPSKKTRRRVMIWCRMKKGITKKYRSWTGMKIRDLMTKYTKMIQRQGLRHSNKSTRDIEWPRYKWAMMLMNSWMMILRANSKKDRKWNILRQRMKMSKLMKEGTWMLKKTKESFHSGLRNRRLGSTLSPSSPDFWHSFEAFHNCLSMLIR